MEEQRPDWLSRALSLALAAGGVAIALVILVLPAYSTETATSSSNGSSTVIAGSQTVFGANPQARPVLIAVIMAGLLVGVLGLLTAWARSATARLLLASVLVILTAVSALSLPSIGLFLLPAVVMGCIVVGRRRGTVATAPRQAEGGPEQHPGD